MATTTAQTTNSVIKQPHVTERTTAFSMDNDHPVYTFVIDKRVNRLAVKSAVKELYGVTPIRVNIVNSPIKPMFRKGILGHKAGFKKAMVYLKKGDKINL